MDSAVDSVHPHTYKRDLSPFVDMRLPSFIEKKSYCPSKIFEVDVFKISGYSEFLLLLIENV